MKNYYANDFWDKLLNKDLSKLFSSTLNQIEQKSIFKEFVEVINLETSTKCNRQCGYCPLSYDNRGNIQITMSKSLINKVINELKEINYDGIVSLNLYNEPLLDDNIENVIASIKENLPNSFVSFNSNGDYLTLDKLLNLNKSGLDEIRITLHSDTYQDENRKKAIDKFFKKLNIEYEISKFVSNETIQVERKFNSTNLIVMCHNWGVIGNDRAGSVELLMQDSKTRNSPCMKPFRELVISAEGNCYPCCNFFPNSEVSKKLIMGNISKESIYNIFSSTIMINFRKNLFDFSPKFSPCNTCNDVDNAKLWSDQIRKEILKNI